MNDKKWSPLKNLSGIATLGFSMPLSIVIGLFIGSILDKAFGTAPILTLVFLVLGIIAAFLTLYREILRVRCDDNI